MEDRLSMLDALSICSFVLGLANYQENLTQTDKAELMRKFDLQTKEILGNIDARLDRIEAIILNKEGYCGLPTDLSRDIEQTSNSNNAT